MFDCHPRRIIQDPHLDKFFTLVYVLEEYSFPFRLKDVIITEANMEGELKASMVALRGALLDTCVRFLHQLLNKLIQLIVFPPVIAGQIGKAAPSIMRCSPAVALKPNIWLLLL